MPCSAFFSVTMPDTGERNVMVRWVSPVATKALICSSEMSQFLSRCKLDATSRAMPNWAGLSAPLSAAAPCTAMAYSRCADTSSGL